MNNLVEYTKWMRNELATRVAEIDAYEVLDREDVAYNEGKVEAYRSVIGLLDSISYPDEMQA